MLESAEDSIRRIPRPRKAQWNGPQEIPGTMGSLRRQPKKQTLPFRARDCQWPNMREGIPMKERLQSDRNFQWPNRAEAQLRKLSWDPHRRWTPLYGRIPMGHPPTAPCLKITMLCFGFLFSQTEPERGESPRERGWKGQLEGGARRRAKINDPTNSGTLSQGRKGPCWACALLGLVPLLGPCLGRQTELP
jgi:hypothetical protein